MAILDSRRLCSTKPTNHLPVIGEAAEHADPEHDVDEALGIAASISSILNKTGDSESEFKASLPLTGTNKRKMAAYQDHTCKIYMLIMHMLC